MLCLAPKWVAELGENFRLLEQDEILGEFRYENRRDRRPPTSELGEFSALNLTQVSDGVSDVGNCVR